MKKKLLHFMLILMCFIIACETGQKNDDVLDGTNKPVIKTPPASNIKNTKSETKSETKPLETTSHTIKTNQSNKPRVKEPVTEPHKIPQETSPDAILNTFNQRLKEITISPLPWDSYKFNYNQWDPWLNTNSTLLNEMIKKLPEGHIIMITGYSDNTSGDAQYDRWLSRRRAYTVYYALIRSGYNGSIFRTAGRGSDELLPGISARDPRQRRVTFSVEKLK